MRLQKRTEQAIVLIVVVGVLAVLSLLAATFGMLMSIELSASRNQTQHEMASEAAQAAAMDLVAQVDSFVKVNGYMPADLSTVLAAPVDNLGTRELYRRDKVKVYTALSPIPSIPGTPPTGSPTAWTLPLGRSYHILFDGVAGVGSSGTSLVDSDAGRGWTATDFTGCYVMQASGNGTGEFRRITGAVGSTLTVSPAWSTVPVAGIEYWVIPSVYSGEFNLNAMGYAGDLGKENSGYYRTSFDASLRRLIASAFDAMSPSDKSTVNAHWGGFSGSAATRQNVAGVIADAIVNWRNGVDYSAGNRMAQDKRPDQLSDANAEALFQYSLGTVNASNISANVTGNGTSWDACMVGGTITIAGGSGPVEIVAVPSATQLTLASNYTATVNSATYVIDGRSVVGSGVSWGKVAFDPPGNVVTATTAWWNNRWTGAYLTFGSGRAKGVTYYVSNDSGGAMALTGGPNPLLAQAGDSFCLHTGAVSPDPLTFLGTRDDKPDGIEWPDAVRFTNGLERTAGTVMTEGGVLWRVFDSGCVSTVAGATFTDGLKNWTVDHVNCLVWLNGGVGAGQVRRIASTAGTALTIDSTTPWTTAPTPYTTAPALNYTTYRLLYPVPAVTGTVTTVNNAPGNVTLDVAGINNQADQFDNCFLFIWAGPGKGQARRIVTNDASGHIVLENAPWQAGDVPLANQSRYGIERYSGEPTQYNPLKAPATAPIYDDRAFNSTADILPVIVEALARSGMNYSDAGKVGGILYNSIRDYLTAAPGRMPPGTVCINDWSLDGYDNNNNGTADEPGETGPTAQQLYDGLGLKAWAGNDVTKIEQAAQLVANIMDFRDADSVPTVLTHAQIDAIPGAGVPTIYGAEGLHLTEIMCAQDRVTATVGSITNDDVGLPDAVANPSADEDGDIDQLGTGTNPDRDGWDWNAAGGYWYVYCAQDATGIWVFPNIAPGTYAIRLQGDSDGDNLFLMDGATAYGADINKKGDGTFWGYPLNGGKLPAVVVGADRKLTLTIKAAHNVVFRGFQLLPQFIEFTNASANDITAENEELTLTTDAGSFKLPPLGTRMTIPGASGDGKFPVNYGSLVIALGQVPYEKQWGDDHDGVWGNTPNENYPVLFVENLGEAALDAMLLGDVSTYDTGKVVTVSLDSHVVGKNGTAWTMSMVNSKIIIDGHESIIQSVNVATQELTVDPAPNLDHPDPGTDYKIVGHFMVPKVSLTVSDGGALIAGTEIGNITDPGVDGQLCAPVPTCSSIEKNVLLQPTYDKAGVFWAPHDPGATALEASQNQHVTTAPNDIFTNLNRQFAPLWATYPTTLNTGLAAPQVLPIILNRPYPSPGWLGLVPTSNAPWRTVDSNPARSTPEELLGMLMDKACVGHAFAQINLNTAPYAVLRSVLPPAAAANLLAAREKTTPWKAWHSWEDVLNDVRFNNSGATEYVGFGANGIEDSGANSFADDSVDDSDEGEEWARRYSNIFTLHSQTMKYVVSGLVYDQLAGLLRYDTGTAKLTADSASVDAKGGANWSGVLPGMEIIVYGPTTYRGTVKSVVTGGGTLTLSGALPTGAHVGLDPNGSPYEILLRGPLAQVRIEVELEQTPTGVVMRSWRYLTD